MRKTSGPILSPHESLLPRRTVAKSCPSLSGQYADSVEIGILILNSPTAGYILTPKEVARLAEIDNICAIKNDGALEHSSEIRKLAGDRIVVSDPNEDNWLVNLVIYGQQVFLASPSPHLFQWKGHLPLKNYTKLAMDGGRLKRPKNSQRRWSLFDGWRRSGSGTPGPKRSPSPRAPEILAGTHRTHSCLCPAPSDRNEPRGEDDDARRTRQGRVACGRLR